MLAQLSTVHVRECKYDASPSLTAGSPHHGVAIMTIEITMATEFLPESKAAQKPEEERENKTKGWGLS